MDYFESIALELSAVENRVRTFIGNSHFQSDGEWKESVLRTVIRRYLPENIGVGRGFFVTNEEKSSQIDILIYDKSKPILFRDGDFVIVTPDLVLGIIEVKTKVGSNNYHEIIEKIEDNFCTLKRNSPNRPFFGLFSYQKGVIRNDEYLLEKMNEISTSFSSHNVDCAAIGPDYFIKYWRLDPNSNNGQEYNRWHLYHLENRAQAYFVHNIIEHLCPKSVFENSELWYPTTGKEDNMIAELHNENA